MPKNRLSSNSSRVTLSSISESNESESSVSESDNLDKNNAKSESSVSESDNLNNNSAKSKCALYAQELTEQYGPNRHICNWTKCKHLQGKGPIPQNIIFI